MLAALKSIKLYGCVILVWVAAAVFCSTAALPAQGSNTKPENGELNQVLSLMNKFGQTFRTFTAKITQKKYIAILKEFDQVENGLFYYERTPNKQARLRKEISEPTPNIAVINNGIVTAYEPRIKQARRIDLGKNKDKAEFLAIGIGQEPKKLEETFHMKILGREVVQGQKTYLLELKPKSAKASSLFSSIILWVDPVRGIPIQQKFLEPNADYTLVCFSDIQINQRISATKFEIKLPKEVEILQ